MPNTFRRRAGIAFLLWFAVGAGLDASHADAAPATPAASTRPNVIVVMSDDQGYGDFSCHGNPVLKTPNLDRLHGQSIRLTDFHVAPMCSPTRGQLHDRHGRTAQRRDLGHCRPVVRPSAAFRRWPTSLPPAAIEPALFGKWHLGDSYPEPAACSEAFRSRSITSAGASRRWPTSGRTTASTAASATTACCKQYQGYCTDVWFELGIDWIRQRQAAGRAVLSLPADQCPARPVLGADKYKAPYKGRGPADFFGMIANLDENMGRLEAVLDETGLATTRSHLSSRQRRHGWREALQRRHARQEDAPITKAAIAPPASSAGPPASCGRRRDVDGLTEVQDLLPTLIELCGLQTPKRATFDGTSLAATLRGHADACPSGCWSCSTVRSRRSGIRPCCGTSGGWSMARNCTTWRPTRARRRTWPTSHPDIVGRLRAHYESWWAGVEPLVEDFSPVSIGADQENPVTLTAADWANVYCDNMKDVRDGWNRNGPWHVLVETGRHVRDRLRRWPMEADAAIAAGVPEFKAVDGGLPAGKPLPIARARLQMGDFDETLPVGRKTRRSPSRSP